MDLDVPDWVWAGLRLLAYAVGTAVLLAGVGAAAYGAVLYRGLFGGTLLVLLFLLGFAFVPIAAYALPLGMRGGETLGNALFQLATLPGTGTMALNQRADDVYEWVRIDENSIQGSDRWWNRFVGSRFGVTYDRERAAFGDLAHSRDELVSQHGDPQHLADGGDVIALDSDRAGFGQFISLDSGNALYVNAAEKLSDLREAAGLEISVRARAAALAEYGGDTSDVSPWAMLAGSFLFLVAGAAMGMLILG
jgi:hypothetical protein